MSFRPSWRLCYGANDALVALVVTYESGGVDVDLGKGQAGANWKIESGWGRHLRTPG